MPHAVTDQKPRMILSGKVGSGGLEDVKLRPETPQEAQASLRFLADASIARKQRETSKPTGGTVAKDKDLPK